MATAPEYRGRLRLHLMLRPAEGARPRSSYRVTDMPTIPFPPQPSALPCCAHTPGWQDLHPRELRPVLGLNHDHSLVLLRLQRLLRADGSHRPCRR